SPRQRAAPLSFPERTTTTLRLRTSAICKFDASISNTPRHHLPSMSSHLPSVKIRTHLCPSAFKKAGFQHRCPQISTDSHNEPPASRIPSCFRSRVLCLVIL